MADIAATFHWSLQEMSQMSLEELLEWRELARARFESNG